MAEETLKVPQLPLYDIERIDPTQYLQAIGAFNLRLRSIESLRTKFQDNFKAYLQREDKIFQKVEISLSNLGQVINQGQAMLDKVIEQLEDQSLVTKQENIQKEIDKLLQEISTHEQAKQNEEEELNKMKNKRQELLTAIDIKVLSQLEIPSKNPKIRFLYQWIIGCLLDSKKRVEDLVGELKLNLERPPAPPPQYEPAAGIFACGKRKLVPPKVISDEEKNRLEEELALKAFRKYIFSEQGQFKEKLSLLQSKKIEDYQKLLIKEMVDEKMEILKSIFEIDVKDQVRMVIDVCQIIQIEQNQQSKATVKQQKEMQEQEKLGQQLDLRNTQKEELQKQLETVAERKQRAVRMKSTIQELQKMVNTKLNLVKQSMATNDDEAKLIEQKIQEIENNISMQMHKLAEQQQREILDQQQKDQERMQQEQEMKQKQQQMEEELEKKKEEEKKKNQKQEKQQELEDQQKKENEKQLKMQDLEQEKQVQQDGKDDQNMADEEDRDQIKPCSEKDPILQNIQRTMYAHLIAGQVSQQKQPVGGGSIMGTLLNRPKKK